MARTSKQPIRTEPKIEEKPLETTDSYISLALGFAVVLVIGLLIYNYISKKPTSDTAKTDEAKAEQQVKGIADLPANHTVEKGETLWSIAEKYYKSGYNWVDIQKANNLKNANDIETGQTLTIPKAEPTVQKSGEISAAATETMKPKDANYTVVRGDTLWAIAEKEYGTGYKWVEIARANKLVNPNIIHAGNTLVLP